jgi:succinate dehydrogenase/fumarate reductase flavoprotein subunit
MRWFKTKDLRSSIYAMFSVSTANRRPPDDGTALESIRELMMTLASMDGSERGAALSRRIRYAMDLQALWFMRGELMQLLAKTHGELAARGKVQEVSSLFEDMLPAGLRSRPSPLNEHYRTSQPFSDEG